MEIEFLTLIRKLSHLDEDTKNIPGAQGVKISKSDILLSQGKGESWSHKQAQINSPYPRTERSPEIPHIPPLTPFSVQSSPEPSDGTPSHTSREITTSRGCPLHLQMALPATHSSFC